MRNRITGLTCTLAVLMLLLGTLAIRPTSAQDNNVTGVRVNEEVPRGAIVVHEVIFRCDDKVVDITSGTTRGFVATENDCTDHNAWQGYSDTASADRAACEHAKKVDANTAYDDYRIMLNHELFDGTTCTPSSQALTTEPTTEPAAPTQTADPGTDAQPTAESTVQSMGRVQERDLGLTSDSAFNWDAIPATVPADTLILAHGDLGQPGCKIGYYDPGETMGLPSNTTYRVVIYTGGSEEQRYDMAKRRVESLLDYDPTCVELA